MTASTILTSALSLLDNPVLQSVILALMTVLVARRMYFMLFRVSSGGASIPDDYEFNANYEFDYEAHHDALVDLYEQHVERDGYSDYLADKYFGDNVPHVDTLWREFENDGGQDMPDFADPTWTNPNAGLYPADFDFDYNYDLDYIDEKGQPR